MAMEKIGLEATLEIGGFKAGLKIYEEGVNKMSTDTQTKSAAMTKSWGGFANHFVITAGDIARAAKIVLDSIVTISTKGLNETVKWGETLDKLGDQFGLTGAEASKWAVAFQHVGLTVEEGAQGLNFFTRGLAETTKAAKDGTKTLTPFGEALQKLGVKAYDARGNLKTFDQVMPEILEAFKKLPPGINASALSMELFGARGGSKFLDFLRQGKQGLIDAEKFAAEFGLTMETNGVDAVEQFGFAINDTKLALQGIWMQIGKEVLPVVKQLIEYINKNVLPAFSKWVKDNMPALQKALRQFGDWLIGDGIPSLVKLARYIGEQVIPAVKAFAKWVKDELLPRLVDLQKWIDNQVIPVLREMWEWISKNVIPALRDLANWIQKEVVPELRNLWEWFAQYILPILKDVALFIKNEILPRLGDFVNFLRTSVFPALGELYRWFKDNVLPVFGQFVSFVTGTMIPALTNLGNNILAIASRVSQMVSSIVSLGSQIYNALVSPFQNAVNWILGIDWSGIGRAIFTTIGNALGAAYSWVYDRFIAPLQNAIAWIVSIDWWGVGGAIFANISAGLNALAGRVAAALQGPLQALLDTINGILRSLGIAIDRSPIAFGGNVTNSNFTSSNVINNTFNLSVATAAPSSQVVADFGILRALAA